MEQHPNRSGNRLHFQYLALTSLWVLLLCWGHLLPALLLGTLLVLTVLLLLATAFRIQSHT